MSLALVGLRTAGRRDPRPGLHREDVPRILCRPASAGIRGIGEERRIVDGTLRVPKTAHAERL